MAIPYKVHTRHLHIRVPELLIDEFEKAIQVAYGTEGKSPNMSTIFRGLMFGYITDKVRFDEDPVKLDAEMYRQEKEFFFEQQEEVKKNLFASKLRK